MVNALTCGDQVQLYGPAVVTQGEIIADPGVAQFEHS